LIFAENVRNVGVSDTPMYLTSNESWLTARIETKKIHNPRRQEFNNNNI